MNHLLCVRPGTGLGTQERELSRTVMCLLSLLLASSRWGGRSVPEISPQSIDAIIKYDACYEQEISPF